MSDLTRTVEEFWNFLWPAAARMSIVVTIVVRLAPRVQTYARLCARRVSIPRAIRYLNSKTAEALGLSKLAPFITLFALLFCMVVTRDIASIVGDALPPVIFWSSPNGHVHLTRTGDLMEAWENYPKSISISDLASAIHKTFREHGKDSGYAFWEMRKGRALSIFDETKFYLLVALLAAVCGRYLGTRWRVIGSRFLKIAFALFLVNSLSVAYAVHCHGKLIESEIIVAREQASIQLTQATVTTEAERKRRLEEIENRKHTSGPWWHLGLPDWTW